MEIEETRAEAVGAILRGAGFSGWGCSGDLAGRDRVVAPKGREGAWP